MLTSSACSSETNTEAAMVPSERASSSLPEVTKVSTGQLEVPSRRPDEGSPAPVRATPTSGLDQAVRHDLTMLIGPARDGTPPEIGVPGLNGEDPVRPRAGGAYPGPGGRG